MEQITRNFKNQITLLILVPNDQIFVTIIYTSPQSCLLTYIYLICTTPSLQPVKKHKLNRNQEIQLTDDSPSTTK